MKWNDPGRDAYLQMQERATQNEKAFHGQGGGKERKPWRTASMAG